MALSWFDAREARNFGISLANFYIERIPLDAAGGKDKSIAKRQEVLNKMYQKMALFRLGHKLNIYKRAQLGNAFKWTLKDAGYDPEIADHLTKELLLIR